MPDQQIQGINQLATPAPKEQNWAESWGFFVAQIAMLFYFVSDCDTKTWQLLNGQGACFGQNKLLIEFLFLVGWIIFIRASKRYLSDTIKPKKIIVKPWKPDIEIPELMEFYLKMYGIRLFLPDFITEPEFGRVSAEDSWKLHLKGEYQDELGVRRPFSASLGKLFREKLSFERNHSHIEINSFSWSGYKKTQDPYLSQFGRKPTQVSFEPHTEPTEESEEEDSDENEE